jgi:acetyl-CoA carboxylase carboxyltransferase component
MIASPAMQQEPRAWIDALIDAGSLLPLDGDGEVVGGLATVDGRGVVVYATDPRIDRGHIGARGATRIRRLMDRAEEQGVPVVAFLASPGIAVDQGLAAGDAYTRVIAANVRLSGVVPQLAAVMGPTMGAPAYSATLMDLVLFNRTRSHLMVTGPAVVEKMLGQTPTLAELGGAEVHAGRTGIAQLVAATAEDQIAALRLLLGFLPANRVEDAPLAAPEEPAAPLPDVPDEPMAPFDMAAFLAGLVDGSPVLELGAAHGASMITALARIAGMPVGVVANQSGVAAGAITADAARKAARFIRLCDAFHLPIVTLIDVPGFMPGAAEESRGLLRHGAQMCMAMQTQVPRLSVVVRKCYGAAAFLMLQTRAQDGDVALALEGSRIAVMGFDAARHLVYQDATASAADLRRRYHEEHESPARAMAAGLIDEVLPAAALRARVVQHLGWLRRKRDRPVDERRRALWP